MITVLVVDDHPLVRAGLSSLLATATDILVIADAGSGTDAVALAIEHSPDVVLMDLSMPGMDGVETTRAVLAAVPTTNVVVLTSFHDRPRVIEALSAGAIGYLLKDSEPGDLLAGIRSASRGESPLDPRVARALLPTVSSVASTPAASTSAASLAPALLSEREEQVLRLITRGYANKQIGTELGIAERTVKVHVGNLFKRIGVADRTSAAMWARDNLAGY